MQANTSAKRALRNIVIDKTVYYGKMGRVIETLTVAICCIYYPRVKNIDVKESVLQLIFVAQSSYCVQ